MIKKVAAVSGAVCTILTLSAPMAVSANRPPPYAFGGGERAVHFGGQATNIGSRPIHTTDTNHASSTTHTGNANSASPGFSLGYVNGEHLGVLTVERFGRTVNVYAGATMESMDIGAGHFSFTGLNYGNVGLIGHNRGSRNGFFSFVRLLQDGDILTLDMGGVVRTYEVFLRTTIEYTDFSLLQQFGDNRLTLITCVEYMRNQRRVVSAREVLQ